MGTCRCLEVLEHCRNFLLSSTNLPAHNHLSAPESKSAEPSKPHHTNYNRTTEKNSSRLRIVIKNGRGGGGLR
jgi:hypothetical protein